MKQRLITMLLAFALLLTMAGCSAAGTARTLDAAGDRIENGLDAAEDRIENAVSGTTVPAPVAAQTAPESAITKEEAEKIALDHVGFTADQVQRLHTEFEIDDGIRQYDVEFYQGDWEYEFEISAETGQILSYDKDHKYD